MLERPEIFILQTQLRFRVYQKLEFMQEVSVQHPKAAYKLHTVYLATDLIWHPKGKERVNRQTIYQSINAQRQRQKNHSI